MPSILARALDMLRDDCAPNNSQTFRIRRGSAEEEANSKKSAASESLTGYRRDDLRRLHSRSRSERDPSRNDEPHRGSVRCERRLALPILRKSRRYSERSARSRVYSHRRDVAEAPHARQVRHAARPGENGRRKPTAALPILAGAPSRAGPGRTATHTDRARA